MISVLLVKSVKTLGTQEAVPRATRECELPQQ
jgi:hypothetical protein